MNINACLTNKSDIWCTPINLYKYYIDQGYFDPCPINPSFDGLKIKWKKLNFVNPPYSQVEQWIRKSISEYELYGNETILLIPARTDTKWFALLVQQGANISFIQGRLRFSNKGYAPFPSMIVRIGENNKLLNPTFKYIFKINRFWKGE